MLYKKEGDEGEEGDDEESLLQIEIEDDTEESPD